MSNKPSSTLSAAAAQSSARTSTSTDQQPILHHHLHVHAHHAPSSAMRWPFWAAEKKDEDQQAPSVAVQSPPRYNGTNASSSMSGSDRRSSSWSAPNLPTSWQHYTKPDVLFPVVVMTSSLFIGRRLYITYIRRITSASRISSSAFGSRSLFGRVTSVGDGDGFRLYHTPGGYLTGWHILPWRRIPKSRSSLKDQTISVRLAGIDAPEVSHFGKPGQPGGKEAWDWLKAYLTGRKVRVHVWKRDQYERAVGTVYVYLWGGLIRRDVGLVMLKKGLATVYEAKSGAEFGGKEDVYRRAEFWAKTWKRGIWRLDGAESPREFKDRTKAEENENNKGGLAAGTKEKVKSAITSIAVGKTKTATGSGSNPDRKTARAKHTTKHESWLN